MRISDWSSDVCSSDLDCIRSLPKCQRTGRCGPSSYPAATETTALRWREMRISTPSTRRDRRAKTRRQCPYPAPLVSIKGYCPARFQANIRASSSKRLQICSRRPKRSEEHTTERPSLLRNSYAVFCLKKQKQQQ